VLKLPVKLSSRSVFFAGQFIARRQEKTWPRDTSSEMKLRTSGKDRSKFWGCTGNPAPNTP
jgi:hypothetical protein